MQSLKLFPNQCVKPLDIMLLGIFETLSTFVYATFYKIKSVTVDSSQQMLLWALSSKRTSFKLSFFEIIIPVVGMCVMI